MKPLLVLVLDADPERRHGIVTLLREAGHQVATTDNPAGDDPIDLGRYDLLVLDPALPPIQFATLNEVLSSIEPPSPDSLEEAERRHLSLMLRHTAGNKRKAAHLLGISRSTLLNKVRKYGLES